MNVYRMMKYTSACARPSQTAQLSSRMMKYTSACARPSQTAQPPCSACARPHRTSMPMCSKSECVQNESDDMNAYTMKHSDGLMSLLVKCLAVCCSMLQCVVVFCNVWQYVAAHCSVLQRLTRSTHTHTGRLKKVESLLIKCLAVCCSMLQYVAVCGNMLQRTAVYCSV